MIHKSVRLYGNNQINENCCILENVIIGYPDAYVLAKIREQGLQIEEYKYQGVSVGEDALIRPNTAIYCDVCIGKNFRTGHNVLIREGTIIGDNVSIGSYSIMEGHISIGNNVNIQSNVYIATNSTVEDYVFIGPNAVLTNDRYPSARKGKDLKGPILRRGVSVGAAAIILPGVDIGRGSMIAAGAIVTKDVPEWKLVIGSPARIVDLPEELKVTNKI